MNVISEEDLCVDGCLFFGEDFQDKEPRGFIRHVSDIALQADLSACRNQTSHENVIIVGAW